MQLAGDAFALRKPFFQARVYAGHSLAKPQPEQCGQQQDPDGDPSQPKSAGFIEKGLLRDSVDYALSLIHI